MTMPSVQEPQRIKATTPRTSVWPVVLGVLSILGGYQAMRLFETGSPGSLVFLVRRFSQGGLDAVLRIFPLWSMFFIGLSALAAGLGIVGGVLLLRRRRAGVVLLWLYALSMAAAVVLFVTGLARSLAGQGPITMPRYYYNLFVNAGLGLAYPVLVIVWLSRRSVRRHARGWRTREGRMKSRPPGPIWHGVVGTLALYWGAKKVLVSLLVLAGTFVPVRSGEDPWLSFLGAWEHLVFGSASLALGVLSIAWGVLLRRRKRAGVILCWVYVAGGALFAFASLIPGLLELLPRWTISLELTLNVALALGDRFLNLLIWPAFLLVWFTRPKVRAHVRSWRRGAPPVAAEVPS